MARLPLRLRAPLNLPMALLCFLACDALLTHSGLYERIVSPDSVAGSAWYFVQFEESRSPTARVWDVLVVGASEVAHSVYPAAAEAAWPSAPLHLVSGGLNGASTRVAYYLLRKLDPHKTRYRMVVVPLLWYHAFTQGQFDDNLGDVDRLAPTIGLGDYLEFSRSFDQWSLEIRALLVGLVGSAYLAPELRSFLTHPRQQLEWIAARKRSGARFNYASNDQAPNLGRDVVGLAFDPRTGALQFPPGLSDEERRLVIASVRPRPPRSAQILSRQNAAYYHEWLGKIVSYYRGTGTRVVFVCMPEGPIRVPWYEPPEGAPSLVDEFRGEPGVSVVDEATFKFLEKPEYFFGLRHLNRAGAGEFSKKLMQVLLEIDRSTAPGVHE
jgi:hypothetical protein